jgi:hypothetical protein
MSSRQKYRKVNLGPSDKITARNSLAGLVVLADYVDPSSGQRTLVLERPAKAVADAPKAVARKKKAAADQPQDAGLAFPAGQTQGA